MKVTFDLHQDRKGFICIGLQLIWAGIKGDKVVWFNDIDCDLVTKNDDPKMIWK